MRIFINRIFYYGISFSSGNKFIKSNDLFSGTSFDVKNNLYYNSSKSRADNNFCGG